MYSYNGINWKSSTSPNENNIWQNVIWCPELLIFIAVGFYSLVVNNNPDIMISFNGKDWYSYTTSYTCRWTSIAWSSALSMFVSVANIGNNKYVTTSEMGLPASRNTILVNQSNMYTTSNYNNLIIASGRLGIGSTDPKYSLDVTNSARFDYIIGDGSQISNLNISNATIGVINSLILPTSGVTTGTYGNSLSVPSFTVDQYGRITSVSTFNINMVNTTNATNITSGILPVERLPVTINNPGNYGSQNNIPIINIDQYGRIISISSTPIIDLSNIVDTSNASNLTIGTLNSARLPSSGVISGDYGSSTYIPSLSIDNYGRITSARSIPYDTSNASNVTTGTLNVSRLPTTGITNVGTYGSSSSIPQITIDSYGRITSIIPYTVQSSQWINNGSNIYYSYGNIGIGKTNPSASLDITGTL